MPIHLSLPVITVVITDTGCIFVGSKVVSGKYQNPLPQLSHGKSVKYLEEVGYPSVQKGSIKWGFVTHRNHRTEGHHHRSEVSKSHHECFAFLTNLEFAQIRGTNNHHFTMSKKAFVIITASNLILVLLRIQSVDGFVSQNPTATKTRLRVGMIQPEKLPSLGSEDRTWRFPPEFNKIALQHNSCNLPAQHNDHSWKDSEFPPGAVSIATRPFDPAAATVAASVYDTSRERMWRSTTAPSGKDFVQDFFNQDEGDSHTEDLSNAYTAKDRTWRFPKPGMVRQEGITPIVDPSSYTSQDRTWRFPASNLLLHETIPRQDFTDEERMWRQPSPQRIRGEATSGLQQVVAYTSQDRTWRFPADHQILHEGVPRAPYLPEERLFRQPTRNQVRQVNNLHSDALLGEELHWDKVPTGSVHLKQDNLRITFWK